jgi:hypothetical protein
MIVLTSYVIITSYISRQDESNLINIAFYVNTPMILTIIEVVTHRVVTCVCYYLMLFSNVTLHYV